MNINSIRSRFPFLKRNFPTSLPTPPRLRGSSKLRGTSKGQSLAYLDNASTTQKPKAVIDAIADIYTNHYANIHRGVYDLSVEATNLYEGVREKVRKFINAKSDKEIIFTRNATEGINLLAYLQGDSLKSGDEILLTQMEHHSNIVPWQMLAKRLKTNDKRWIEIKYIPINREGRLELGKLDQLISKKTKIVSLTLMSNVLGTVNPIKKIALVVRRLAPSAVLIIDAAQAVGHMKIDVGDLDCDFLVFSAHKMYGPSGVGVLWGRRHLLESMPPFMGGGDMILAVDFEKTTFNELPWKFEAGTPNIADVIAYGAALDFIPSIGFSQIKNHEMELTKYALKILSNDPTIQLFGPDSLKDRGPVIAFNVDGVHPHDVASILSDQRVAIRSGHHCAQPLMGVLGINAAARASFGIYNTEEEVDRLIEGIEKVKEVFRLKTKARLPKPGTGGQAKRLTPESFKSVSP